MILSEVREYKVQERIGRGSFGEVFLVVHKQSRKQYVLKRVRLARQNEWQRAASHLEMFLAKQLWHPFIVPHVESWVDRGHTIHLVHEYCINGDLHSLLQRLKGKSIPEDQLKLWLAQALLAMDYLHGHGIVHRDLKLSNLFLNDDGDVLLGDFGLAAFRRGAANEDNSLVGTPQYMSPELLSSDRYGLPTDIWSLGCCLWELTSGRPAFQAFNFDGLVQKITKGQAGTLPMQYSEGWAALLRTMLIKNPDRRASISSILEAPCMRHAVRDATARCRLLAKSMGIEELPPICRTPRLDELEEDGQATTAEILRRAHIPLGIHPENSEDNRTLTARSAPDESQSSMHDMEEIPFQDSRQDALHPGAMTPSAQKIAAAAAQSETPASRRLNYNTKFGGSEMMETSVMEGMDGALYLSPSMDGSGMGMPASASNSHRTHEPHMVLEIEDAAASSEGPNSSLGRAGQGPTSAAMQPVMAPTHADEHPRQMYSNQHPLSGQDLPSPGDNLLEQRPSDTGMPDEASLRQRQPKPQPMLSTEAHFGPASGASSPPESAAGLGDDQGLDGFRRRSTLQHQSNASTNKKLHTAPAAPEQDSFAGKATEQWQSTRPGRGRDTAAARRAQMAGDQGAKTNANGGVRKMLRSASDACKRLAEGVATNTRESRRQRSKSQAPSATESRAPTRGRLAGQATSGVKGTTSTAGAGRLGARGAATTGVTGSKVPGSVEIRMQQRAMRQFDKNNNRTGRTGRAATARDSETVDKETNSVHGRGSVSARGSTVSRRTSSVQPRPVSRTTTTRTGRDQSTRDKSRTRSRTVTPRTNNSPTRAAALQTAPAAPVEPPSWQMSPAVERALQTLPSTSDALNAANSGPASAATDTGDMSRMMNSLASEPGTASNNVQKELSLMHSTMPATLASDAVPTTWANDASVPDLGKDMQIHPPAPMHAHSRTDSMGDRLPGEVLESAASGNPQTPGLNDTNAAMDYAGFDGGHSLYTIADASGLMTPASGMATPGGMSTPGGMTPPSRDRAHERKFSTAPSSEESWVEMGAGAAGSSRNGSGWQVQGQPWASNKSSRNGSIDDTPITPAEPSIGGGSLSPLGPHGMLPAGGPEGKAVFQPSPTKPTGARGPLDSDEHLRIHIEHHKRLQASSSAKDVLDSGRTASGESSFANSGGTSPRKSKGAGGSLEEALGTAVEEAYKLLQEKKYAQAEAVLDGARKRYQRNRSMLERFDNNAKARVSGSGTGVTANNAGRVSGTASAAPTTRRTPVRRSGSVGPSAMQTRVEARSKRGASSARGVSSTRERGLKSPATKASPGRSTGSGTLARGRTRQPAAAASMAAGNKGPVTTMQMSQMDRKNSGKKSSSGDIQSHPVGGYPSIMPASAPVVVQQPLNSAVSLTGPANSGPRSLGGSDGGGDIELDMGGVSAGVGAGQVVSIANAAMNGPKSLPTEVLSMSDTLAGVASPERGPVSAADESAARVGDVVRVGKVRAVVRYVGPVKGLSRGPWVGLELSHPCGTGTGTINGIEYFSCAPQCGAFVALDKLMPDNDAYSTDI